MKKQWLKRILIAAGIAAGASLILLIYTFLPMKIDVAGYPAASFAAAAGKIDPARLPEVELAILKTGKMPAWRAFSYRGGSWSETCENGMAAILVRHPRATFLIDAGFGSHVDEHWRTIPGLMRALSTYVKETPAAAQLQGQGIARDQVKFAIITHSHWDHISGLEDFPGIEVRMPQSELSFIRERKMPGLIDQMIDQLNIRTFDFSGGPYENFERSLDLFDDGSVVLVPLPGHTDGSTGIFVNLHSGRRFFFTGDLTWSMEGFQLPAERPWLARRLVDYDEAEVRRSIVRVHQLMQKYPDLKVVPAHDRRIHDQISTLPNLER
jgi:glyoxylase-like metal-dependent hydrolase (beta-lactamase superfamily II)